jgi:hypothetical protein
VKENGFDNAITMHLRVFSDHPYMGIITTYSTYAGDWITASLKRSPPLAWLGLAWLGLDWIGLEDAWFDSSTTTVPLIVRTPGGRNACSGRVVPERVQQVFEI